MIAANLHIAPNYQLSIWPVMFVKPARDYAKLKHYLRKNRYVLLDYLLLVCVFSFIIFCGIYAELLGGLVARFIEQIRKLFA